MLFEKAAFIVYIGRASVKANDHFLVNHIANFILRERSVHTCLVKGFIIFLVLYSMSPGIEVETLAQKMIKATSLSLEKQGPSVNIYEGNTLFDL